MSGDAEDLTSPEQSQERLPLRKAWKIIRKLKDVHAAMVEALLQNPAGVFVLMWSLFRRDRFADSGRCLQDGAPEGQQFLTC